MSITAFDPLRLLRSLSEGGVRFVVIGEMAGLPWGLPVMSILEICPEATAKNREALDKALQRLGARPRGREDAFETVAGPLDSVVVPAGTEGFEDLLRASVEYDIGDGVRVRFCSLEDLIRMKQAAARPIDRIALEILGTVKKRR